MKKYVLSVILICVILFHNLSFVSANNQNIYSETIDEIIKQYGFFQTDENHKLYGLIYGEFIDFDNNGTKEMLLIYKDKNDKIFRCANIAVYAETNGQLTKVFDEGIYSYLGQTDIGYRIHIKKFDEKTYLVVNTDDKSIDNGDVETISVFSMSNGTPEQNEYYGEVLPWWDTHQFEYTKCMIDGNVVSEEVYKNKLNSFYDNSKRLVILSNNSEFVGNSYYCTHDGLMRFVEQAENISVEKSQLTDILHTYIAKLRSLELEIASSRETPLYYIYDINKNSVPELIIKRGTCEADYYFDVFSYINGETTHIGKLPGGHISLCGVAEKGILLYCAHMGYEMIFEGSMDNNQITYKKIYEEDCSNKEYEYEKDIGEFRLGARFLEFSEDVSDHNLLYQHFELLNYVENLIKVTINGMGILFDQDPVIIDGRTMVPLRAIFEALGANVSWEDSTQTVTATKNTKTISMKIGSTDLNIDGMIKVLDVPAQLIGGRTLVPVRAISEAFDCNVEWDSFTKTVKITQ